MQDGSRNLARAVTAYLTCLTFALAFLVTTATGGGGLTAVLRGALAAAAMWFLGGLLMRPLVVTVFDAMARDRAAVEADAATAEAATAEAGSEDTE